MLLPILLLTLLATVLYIDALAPRTLLQPTGPLIHLLTLPTHVALGGHLRILQLHLPHAIDHDIGDDVDAARCVIRNSLPFSLVVEAL